MELIDTHCHIDLEVFQPDLDQVLEQARTAGLGAIVVPAIQQSNWCAVQKVCALHSGFLFPALGLHPVFVDQHLDRHLNELVVALQDSTVIAVGEIGLDFYIKSLPRVRQLQLFEAQLEIASQARLPVILHIRKAYDEVIRLLSKSTLHGGIAHAFNGSRQQAFKLIDHGFMLGFGGTMTYSNASRIHRLARELPLDAMVLETDAPDMVVAQFRGERNSPAYLPYCLQALAQLRSESPDIIAQVTTANARHVLKLPSRRSA